MTLVKPVIFLSSTRMDLENYRREARGLIERRKLECFGQEDFADHGERNDAEVFSLDRMEEKGCNWYLGIIGFRQGHIVEGGTIGVTEAEYNYALKLRDEGRYKRVFVMIARNIDDFTNQGDIFDHRDRWDSDPKTLERFNQFNIFRENLIKNVSSVFSSCEEFKDQLNRILYENWEKPRDNIFREIVTRENKLLRLTIRIHDVIDTTRSTLYKLRYYKELHDQVHIFRQRVIVTVDDLLTSPSMDMDWENTYSAKFINYHGMLRDLRSGIEKIENTERSNESDRIQVELNVLKEHENLFFNELILHKGSELIQNDFSEPFRTHFDQLGSAIESLFKNFNGSLQKMADALKEPAKQVVSSLRNPVVNGEIKLENSQDRKNWLTELEHLDGSSDRLIDSVKGHNQWQKCHDSLLPLDKLRRDLIYCSLDETECRESQPYIAQRFIEELKVTLIEPDADSDTSFLCEFLSLKSDSSCAQGSSNDQSARAMGLISREDKWELEKAIQALHRAFEPCSALNLESGVISASDKTADSALGRLIEKYNSFRTAFNNIFFRVDVKLRDDAVYSSDRVEELLKLLREIGRTVEPQDA